MFPGIGGPKERKRDGGMAGWWSSQNTLLSIKFTVSYECVLWGPITITIVKPKVTDQCIITNIIIMKTFEILQYQNVAQRHEVSSFWKNDIDRLA